MVAAHEEGKVGRAAAAGIVLVEIADGAVFGRHGHGGQVVGVAHGLEVAADDEQGDAVEPVVELAGFGDGGVD